MQKRISSTKRFTAGDYTITVAAGVKNGQAVVVFGLQTGLEAVPVFTLEKKWRCLEDADRYVQSITIVTAEKFLAHYQEHYQPMTEKVNHAFTRKLGFIAPDITPGRYPIRGRR